jgi:hypothetical protein
MTPKAVIEERFDAGGSLPPHRHREAYAALVVSGG